MTVPQEVKLARHAGDLDDDGHDSHPLGDASSVTFTPTGTIAATDVQAAIVEVASDAAAALADHVAASGPGTGDHEHMINVFNGDASTTTFEISDEPLDPEAVYAFVGGTWTAIIVSGAMNTVVTFGSAPGSGTGNVVIQYPAVAA